MLATNAPVLSRPGPPGRDRGQACTLCWETHLCAKSVSIDNEGNLCAYVQAAGYCNFATVSSQRGNGRERAVRFLQSWGAEEEEEEEEIFY